VKLRLLVLTILGVLVALGMVVVAPVANAAMVTKIMYAEENTTFYSYTSSTAGHFNVTLFWGSPDGTGAFPQSEVDGAVQGPGPSYSDITPDTLYEGTNPELGQVPATGNPDLPAGTYYFGVRPCVGDVPFHLVVTFTPSGGSATTVLNNSGMAYASDGRVYVPSDGHWISSVQQWAGTGSSYYAAWIDYVQQSVFGSSFDVLSDQHDVTWVPPQVTERNTIGGGAPNPNSGEWYSVTPQILYSAAQPVTMSNPGTSLVLPGSIADTTAPAWYTYAYPDASQTTQKMAFFFSAGHNAAASKRSCSGNTSTNASVSFKFYGDTLDWHYMTNPLGCKANVTIDGAPPTNVQGPAVVDQSSALFVYGAVTHYAGLGAGYHTITVTNSGLSGASHVASPATELLTHDSFYAADDATDPPLMHENNYDGSTAYQFCSATPPLGTNPAPHGGTCSGSTSTNDAVACYFKGTGIDFYYSTTPLGCLANVLIDGQPPSPLQGMAVIDQSSSDSNFHYLVKSSYSGLVNTTHIILIYNTGLPGAYHVASPATELFIVDAFNYTPPGQPTVWVDDK
jgi:hypothetical protein